MRRVAILAIVLGCGGSTAAYAAGVSPATAQALNAAAFAAPTSSSDSIGNLLDRQGLVGWNGRQALVGRAGGAVDTLSIREGQLAGGPGELPLTQRSAIDPKAYEIGLMRNWPGAVNFDTGHVNVDVTPRASLGVISGDKARGSSAEAGATVELSRADAAAARLKALGVKDGSQFGDQGRWYLFAAASGRAVGMNMLHGDAGWNRAGWSTDTTSKLVGDAQVGVGWRKGPMQTSVGYVHRKVKGEHLMYGIDPHDDDMVAFSLSIRPRK